jgi:membrane protease YdiL (CAAX protease family)
MDTLELLSLLKALYAVALTVLAFLAYQRLGGHPASNGNVLALQEKRNEVVQGFLYRKGLGLVFFGLLPALAFFPFFSLEPARLMTGRPYLPGSLPALMALAALVMVTSARHLGAGNRLPLMRLPLWDPLAILTSVAGWGLYLLGYEFLFRGLLLFSWAEAFGPGPALAVNLLLYVAVHLQNGYREAAGSLVFGIILCLLSLQSGGFFMAWILHLTLSVSAEMGAVHFRPDMHFVFRTKKK